MLLSLSYKPETTASHPYMTHQDHTWAQKFAEPTAEVTAGCVLGPGKWEEKVSPVLNASPCVRQMAALREAPAADAAGLWDQCGPDRAG